MGSDTRRRRNREYILKRKSKDKCVRCKSSRNITYHHRDPRTKRFNISEAPRLKVSLDKLNAEFAKCDVLCEKCHRLEHENNIDPPIGFNSEDFLISTLTGDVVTVIVVYVPSQVGYIGEHPTSRRIAHDQAIELFLNDIYGS